MLCQMATQEQFSTFCNLFPGAAAPGKSSIASISANLRTFDIGKASILLHTDIEVQNFNIKVWCLFMRYYIKVLNFNIEVQYHTLYQKKILIFDIEVFSPQYRDIQISKFQTTILKFANLSRCVIHYYILPVILSIILLLHILKKLYSFIHPIIPYNSKYVILF